MTEKPLPLSERNGPIGRLFQHECAGVVVLTSQRDGKTIDSARFVFLRIAHSWYRISFWDRSMSCKLDDLSSPTYQSVADGYSYKQTDLSPLLLADTVRITDAHLTEGFNYTNCVFSFTHARSLQLRNYWDSGRTLLSII
jgi:hypothetical protein